MADRDAPPGFNRQPRSWATTEVSASQEQLTDIKEWSAAQLIELWQLPGLRAKERLFIRFLLRQGQVIESNDGSYRFKDPKFGSGATR